MQALIAFLFRLGQRLLAMWVRVSATGEAPPHEGRVFYILETDSRSDAMVLAEYCAQQRLPLAHTRHVKATHVNCVGLPHRPAGGPASATGSINNLPDDPTLLLQPVSIYWGRAPARQDSLWKLFFADTWAVTGGLRKLLTILFNGRETRLHFGDAIKLSELLATHNGDHRAAQQSLAQDFKAYRTGIIGPDLSHRRTVVRDVLASTSVQAAIEAESNGASTNAASEKAAQYANEIASDFSYATTRVTFLLLEWLWNRLYKGVSVYHNEQLTPLAAKYSLVYVPCHRSHIDSFLLGYTLDANQMPTPNFAAGINMNMPVIGGIFRRLGAFYLRRSFKDNALYKAVFSEYLYSMFSRGSPVAYFVEGTRSRTGRTLPPKAGMLSMTVRSYLRQPSRPIAFVPVYAGYEKIIEERSYLGELRGKNKKGESLLGALSSVRYLFSQFGRVYLNFGQPIILDELLDTARPGWRDDALPDEGTADWVKPVVNQLATLVGQRINEAVVVNGINLAALALLSTPRQAMGEAQLLKQLQLYHDLLTVLPYSNAVVLAEDSPAAMLKSVEELGLLERIPNALGDILRLQGNEAVLMSYYRNNVLHLLALPALIAALFRLNERLPPEAILSACRSLYPFLQAELQLHWTEQELNEPVEQWLKTLQSKGLLIEEGDELRRPSTGTPQVQQLAILGDCIRPTMERFEIVMSVLEQTGGLSDNKQLADQCQLVAQRLTALYGFNAPEFSDPVLFRSFIALLTDMKLLEASANQRLSLTERGHAASSYAELILDGDMLGNIALLSAESNERTAVE